MCSSSSWTQLTVPKTFRLGGGKVIISKMNAFESNGTGLPHKYRETLCSFKHNSLHS